MLFNFLLFSFDEDSLENLRYEAVEAESNADAVKIYILGDTVDTGYIAILIGNVLKYDSMEGNASNLRDKFEKATGLELGEIPEFYSMDKNKLQIVGDGYRQVIDENLDEITEFINGLLTGRSYFQVIPIVTILTGSKVKSATKR